MVETVERRLANMPVEKSISVHLRTVGASANQSLCSCAKPLLLVSLSWPAWMVNATARFQNAPQSNAIASHMLRPKRRSALQPFFDPFLNVCKIQNTLKGNSRPGQDFHHDGNPVTNKFLLAVVPLLTSLRNSVNV